MPTIAKKRYKIAKTDTSRTAWIDANNKIRKTVFLAPHSQSDQWGILTMKLLGQKRVPLEW